MPLTDTAIRKAKPRDKPRKLYDSRGLYLEIAPRGTKAWRFKYRFADKEKRISMGIYPEVSLKLARERRDDSRKLLARDIDPSAYRKAQKQSKRQWARNSFEAVAAEWLAKHSPNWCASYARRLERDLGRDIFRGSERSRSRSSRHRSCWPRCAASKPAAPWTRRIARFRSVGGCCAMRWQRAERSGTCRGTCAEPSLR